jgi:hypothetical protein
MTGVIRESENAGEALKKIADNMADVFISAIMKMIANYALLGSITGEKGGWGSTGGGWGGILGLVASIFGEGGVVRGWRPLAQIPRFQHGTVVDRPTLGIIGEGGEREWVIPESKIGRSQVGQGGSANIFYIYANDPISFRDFIRRNPDAIIEAVHKDVRTRGTTRSDIKRYG